MQTVSVDLEQFGYFTTIPIEDAIAAADKAGILGADGQVTLEELALVDLTELPPEQYGTGGASNVRTLRDFVTALVRTVGHYRGEGECAPRVR